MQSAVKKYVLPSIVWSDELLTHCQICSHDPATNLVHVGPLCTHVYEGKVCPRGRTCHFRHGVDVEAKGIEHRLLHHRKYFPEGTRANPTGAQNTLS